MGLPLRLFYCVIVLPWRNYTAMVGPLLTDDVMDLQTYCTLLSASQATVNVCHIFTYFFVCYNFFSLSLFYNSFGDLFENQFYF